MGYSIKLEKEILTQVRDWYFDANSPSGLMPADDLSLALFRDALIEISGESETHAKLLAEHIRILDEREWISIETDQVTFIRTATITGHGMDRLDWHASREAMPRIVRAIKSTTGILMTSVLLPVVMATMTVFVLRYLGLESGNFTLEEAVK